RPRPRAVDVRSPADGDGGLPHAAVPIVVDPRSVRGERIVDAGPGRYALLGGGLVPAVLLLVPILRVDGVCTADRSVQQQHGGEDGGRNGPPTRRNTPPRARL